MLFMEAPLLKLFIFIVVLEIPFLGENKLLSSWFCRAWTSFGDKSEVAEGVTELSARYSA